VRAGRHTFSYWSTHGSDDSVAGYQATAAAAEELTAATVSEAVVVVTA